MVPCCAPGARHPRAERAVAQPRVDRDRRGVDRGEIRYAVAREICREDLPQARTADESSARRRRAARGGPCAPAVAATALENATASHAVRSLLSRDLIVVSHVAEDNPADDVTERDEVSANVCVSAATPRAGGVTSRLPPRVGRLWFNHGGQSTRRTGSSGGCDTASPHGEDRGVEIREPGPALTDALPRRQCRRAGRWRRSSGSLRVGRPAGKRVPALAPACRRVRTD